MNKYKPEYLGKIIPVDEPSKLTDFVQHKFEAFSKIYEICKEQSDGISDISTVENPSTEPNSLSVKLTTTMDISAKIKENTLDDPSIKFNGYTITASVK